MTLKEVAGQLELKVRAGHTAIEKEVQSGYVSDMLSDVIANAGQGSVWLTLQSHQNIIAVATLKEMAGIIIIGGKEPQDATIKKAEEEHVVLMTTPLSAFETAGRLYELGVRSQV